MGCCNDCKYYGAVPDYLSEDGFSNEDVSTTMGCVLTRNPQEPYDSCDEFEPRYCSYDDDDDFGGGDGDDDLFEIFINPGAIYRFMG